MAIHVRESREMEAPIEEVWSWMLHNETVWRAPFVQDVQKVQEGSGPHGEIGALYETKTKYLVIPSRSVQKITAYDPPRLISWDTIEGGGMIPQKESSYILEEAGEGRTRVILDFTYDTKGIARVMEPVMRGGMSNTLQMLLGNIEKGVTS
ncbi:MAG: SRPBCC family protein [Candidatus Promineifilaceae bacterium]|nr:SRPBCC family protein [Candidatus Promineifilaceae bacterium]